VQCLHVRRGQGGGITRAQGTVEEAGLVWVGRHTAHAHLGRWQGGVVRSNRRRGKLRCGQFCVGPLIVVSSTLADLEATVAGHHTGALEL
jgi:hypothetical protein